MCDDKVNGFSKEDAFFRVDVQRAVRDQSGNMEKVISIFGQPENCSKACIKVLEVVIREAEKENNGQTSVHPLLVRRLLVPTIAV